MSTILELRNELNLLADAQKAKFLQGYFKTGKGEYGEGDIFIGIKVPELRKIAHKFHSLSLNEVKKLMSSKIHEERFISMEILVFKYEKSNKKEKEKIYNFYLKNTKFINNWDLVDTSAPYIIGEY